MADVAAAILAARSSRRVNGASWHHGLISWPPATPGGQDRFGRVLLPGLGPVIRQAGPCSIRAGLDWTHEQLEQVGGQILVYICWPAMFLDYPQVAHRRSTNTVSLVHPQDRSRLARLARRTRSSAPCRPSPATKCHFDRTHPVQNETPNWALGHLTPRVVSVKCVWGQA
jgi:hypothetical protein